jgi:hypothetical protein
MNYLFEYGLWEQDYIVKELLPKGNVVNISNLEEYHSTCDVFAFSSRTHSYWSIKNLIKKIKPKIVIMLSDEFCDDNFYNFNALGYECELFLRNYNHQYYNYTKNTIVFPLGYTNDCQVYSSFKKYDWSFIGQIKSDRNEMLNTFSQLPLHYVSNQVPKKRMCEIYSQSYFVPCGRGNSSLDCFRLYEASMNGSIPVVVGPKDELEHTFKYEDNPPWVFAQTWNEAFEICNDLLQDKFTLNDKTNEVQLWWSNRINKIKQKIQFVLVDSQSL